MGRVEDEERERDLVDPVAEQADELADPERRERAVEREADVRMVARRRRPAGDRGGRRPGSTACLERVELARQWRNGRRGEAGLRAAEYERALQDGRLGEARREPRLRPDAETLHRRVDRPREASRAGQASE